MSKSSPSPSRRDVHEVKQVDLPAEGVNQEWHKLVEGDVLEFVWNRKTWRYEIGGIDKVTETIDFVMKGGRTWHLPVSVKEDGKKL